MHHFWRVIQPIVFVLIACYNELDCYIAVSRIYSSPELAYIFEVNAGEEYNIDPYLEVVGSDGGKIINAQYWENREAYAVPVSENGLSFVAPEEDVYRVSITVLRSDGSEKNLDIKVLHE